MNGRTEELLERHASAMHFAEILFSCSAERVFHMSVTETGGHDIPPDKQRDVDALGVLLFIQLIKKPDPPRINAIAIF